jgi:hypothetical protein
LPERLLRSTFGLGRRLDPDPNPDPDPEALDAEPFKFTFDLEFEFEFEEESAGLVIGTPELGLEFEEDLRSKCSSESGMPWALASSRRFT